MSSGREIHLRATEGLCHATKAWCRSCVHWSLSHRVVLSPFSKHVSHLSLCLHGPD
uniref:Uncharacterized protein n=1 Tax=Anguilla anguilla TaxID=7936 RepID=A0A0E9PNF9_ANGAN